MAKHNWQAIHNEYVYAPDEESRPTLEALAAQHNCSPSYLREKAAKEEWKLEAERYLQTVQTKRQDQKSTALAGELAEWDTQCFKMAQGAMKILYMHVRSAIDSEEPIPLKDMKPMAEAIELEIRVEQYQQFWEDCLLHSSVFDR